MSRSNQLRGFCGADVLLEFGGELKGVIQILLACIHFFVLFSEASEEYLSMASGVGLLLF